MFRWEKKMSSMAKSGGKSPEPARSTAMRNRDPEARTSGILDLQFTSVDPITITSTIGGTADVEYADELLLSVLVPTAIPRIDCDPPDDPGEPFEIEPNDLLDHSEDQVSSFAPSQQMDIHGTTGLVDLERYAAEASSPQAAISAFNLAPSGVADQTAGSAGSADPVPQPASDRNAGANNSVCFLEGTRIFGLNGDIPVETMNRGDRLITKSGAMRPVRWVGRRTIDSHRHPRPETVWPVRIERGAIDDGLPERTLYLSPDHAIYLDGCLVPAKALVNGRSIVQEQRRSFTYYHIELETHDILLAEGLPTESYLDTGNRRFFESDDDAMTLHPDFAQTMRETRSCAPFVESGPMLAAIRARIDARLPAAEMTTDPVLRVLANGRFLPVSSLDPMTYAVQLPASPTDLRLMSNVVVPAEQHPDAEDRRHLGLDVVQLLIMNEGRMVHVPLESEMLAEGWYALESGHRWTNGDAVIPASLTAGAKTLLVRLAGPTSYPVAGAAAAEVGS
jgi:hypothetical protein